MMIQSPLLAISSVPYIQRQPQDAAKAALDDLRASDARIRAEAAASASRYGAGATSTVTFNYIVGPDGQLYATDATVSTSKRTQGARNPNLALEDQQGATSQPLGLEQRAKARLNDILSPRAQLSPADEAAIYGSDDFLKETLQSNEAQARAKLQLYDLAVRAQEGQHFRAAFGLGTAPEYDYEVGPDGELYAVAGEVGIRTSGFKTPEAAAKDADTIARAALAATDVSAQDISVARTAQSRAAEFYAQMSYSVYRETPLFQLAA